MSYKRRGQLYDVLLIRDQLLQAGFLLDTISYNIVIGRGKGRPARLCIRAVRKDDALGCEPSVSTFTCLIDACGKHNELDLAEKLLDQMELEHSNACTYTSLVQACAANAALGRASAFYDAW